MRQGLDLPGLYRRRTPRLACFSSGVTPLEMQPLDRMSVRLRTEVAKAISPKSIAVLPLLNESGDPGDEYFSDGLSEELIAALGKSETSRSSGAVLLFVSKTGKRNPKRSERNWV